MDRRRSWPLAAAMASWAALGAGCSSDATPAVEDGEPTSAGDPHMVADCRSETMPSANPAVLTHVRVICDDEDLPSRALHVAPGHDGVYVTAPGSQAPWILRVRDDASVDTLIEGLPQLVGGDVLLAVDGDGRPHGASNGYVRAAPDPAVSGALSLELVDDQWVPELVDPYEHYGPVVAQEHDPSGRRILWYAHEPPEGYRRATLDDDGWQIESAGSDCDRFGLASDGSELCLRLSGVALSVQGAGSTSTFTRPPGPFIVAPPAHPPLPSSEPAFVLASLHEGIVVAWPSGDAVVEHRIAGAEAIVESCQGFDFEDCPESCHETGRGVYDDAFTVARTGDGRIWVLYVETILDHWVEYSRSPEGDDPECRREVAQRSDTSVLHLVEVGPDGSTSEVLDVSVEGHLAYLDMRAHGTHLAIGFQESPDDVPYLRVLRVDVAQL